MEEVETDSELVREAQGGSDDAFRELVSRYKNYVFSIIGRTVGNRELAEDLSQDVFVKAYRGLARYRGDAAFKTWITRITLNTTHSYFRSKRFSQHKQTVSLDDKKREEVGSHDGDPLVSEQILLALRYCYGEMKLPLQEVITLCGYQEESYEQAARLLAIPIGTVRSRLNRARIALKECMKKKEVL